MSKAIIIISLFAAVNDLHKVIDILQLAAITDGITETDYRTIYKSAINRIQELKKEV